MKFYLYMSDTQAEVCQDIVNLSRKLFPCPLQIPLERTPEIPALVHFLSSSNTTGLAFFNSHIASPQARRCYLPRRSCTPSIGGGSVKSQECIRQQQTMWTLPVIQLLYPYPLTTAAHWTYNALFGHIVHCTYKATFKQDTMII